MTTKLEPTADSLAAYLITETTLSARQDPAAFLQTLADIGTDKLAELTIVDEYDVPDDLYWIFDIDDDETERLDALFALRNDERVYDLLFAAIIRLTEELR